MVFFVVFCVVGSLSVSLTSRMVHTAVGIQEDVVLFFLLLFLHGSDIPSSFFSVVVFFFFFGKGGVGGLL